MSHIRDNIVPVMNKYPIDEVKLIFQSDEFEPFFVNLRIRCAHTTRANAMTRLYFIKHIQQSQGKSVNS